MSQKMYRPEFSTATDARVLQTRNALRKALLELLEEKSIDKISVREIVAAAGVGYNTFFRHYTDKDFILQDIAAEEIRKLVSLSSAVMDTEDIQSACLAMCNHVAKNKKLWKTLLTGGAAETLRKEFIQASREVVEPRPRDKDWLPLDIAIILVTSGIFELLAWWLGENDPLSVEQVAEICRKIIVSPVIDS
ncbi:TetR/AcrR family transcriptional regulator [Emcibacter sp.]|uniref:TetR/AcrR family transcriptional regulator n=1 Tax=Emcibacter sp. TaxID=1979954 RepID=UPI002AA73C3F|nr:TetR/AcrR family transcriptional regulator [Emcibacter sp.]